MGGISSFMDSHPRFKGFFNKVSKDNVGFLASALAWSLLTSMVPIVVGLLAISTFFLRDPSVQNATVQHLSQALQGVLSTSDLQHLVQLTTQHAGLLGIIGFLGVLWGGSNVGGSISTVFQPIFQVKGRSFIHEKLIDIGMIVVFTVLLIVIVLATSAGALLDRLFSGFPLPGVVQFVIGTAIAVAAAFLLFAVTYIVFPNAETRFKLHNVWPGALVAAVLFEILSFIWPIYSSFAHFNRYGSMLGAIAVLTAWLYFLSIVLIIGAEFVSLGAIEESVKEKEAIGPPPDGTVPQRDDEDIQVERREIGERYHALR
ncbi:MAG: YihY/virulence factor BrkB family protein [Chloroflexi bacterium]|nr:YihY/virulence factor BrkB family protein [Chloroflexota bacterium]